MATSAVKPVRPSWWLFFLICIPIFIGSVDLTAVIVVLPQAALDLLGPEGIGRADVALWVITAYLLAYTISLVFAGRLSDIWGRKNVFLAVTAIFILGSFWSGAATDFPLQLLRLIPILNNNADLPLISLIIGRVVQAVGAGASVSVGMALVGDLYPPEQRTRLVSLIGGIDSLGWVAGNIGGGLLLQVFPSWRWLFYLSGFVAIPALVLVWFALRRVPTVGNGGKFDWLGAALFAFALMGLTFGVEGISGGHSIGYILTIGSLILFPTLFIYQWRKGQNALFNLSFIRRPEIFIALFNNLLVGLALILLVAGVPIIINLRTIFLQGNGLLTGALNAGLVLCALTAPLLLAVMIGENNYKRVGAAIPTALGFALAAGGFLLAALTWQYESASAIIVLPLVLVGIGLGLTFGPLGLIVIEAAPEGERGMASSLVIMARLLGMTIGTPLAGTLTLKLANDRIVEQTRTFSSDYRYIAQSMILPVELTRALGQVLFVGVIVCLVGFTLFYAPRALASVRQLKFSRLPGVLIGWLLLAILGIVVYSVALSDGRSPQVYTPIARQLPANTVYYAATNAQTIFLSPSTSALDAVLSIFQRLQNPVVNVPRPGATETDFVRLSMSQTPPAQTAQPDLLIDGVKLLFGVENWTDANFRAFCPEPAPAEPARWRDCFSNALLGWLGPHLGVGAWDSPAQDRATPEYRYMFAIQTTNFNNAYVFALRLAQSLNEKPPTDLGPNRRLLTLNAGKPNERLVAITDDYMYIGTPGAVREVLNFKRETPRLATQPEFNAMLDRVGGTTAFVTGYARSQRFFEDLRGTLNSLLGNALIDPLLQTLSKLAVFRPAEGNSQPVQLGVALKIEDKLVAIKAVSDFPAELPNFKPGQVPLRTLDVIPNRSPLWAATRFNLEDILRDIKLQDILGLVADLSGAQDLRNLLNNGLVNFGANVVDGQLRGVLNQTNGDLLFVQMPGANPQTAGDLVFVLPLKAAADARQQATRSLRDLDGTLGLIANFSDLDHRAQTYPGSSARVTTLNGKIFGGSSINGVQYAITENNLLVISLADRGAAFAQMLAALEDKEPNAVAAELSTNLQDYFLYTYIDDNNPVNGSKIWLGAKLMRRTLVIDGTLVTK